MLIASSYDTALCVFPTGVPEGGLNLGEIRQLSQALIDGNDGDCNMYGRISVNHIDKNESREGYLEFDWDSNAGCAGNCIDPAKQITPTVTPTPSSMAAKRLVGMWDLSYVKAPFMVPGAVIWLGLFIFV